MGVSRSLGRLDDPLRGRTYRTLRTRCAVRARSTCRTARALRAHRSGCTCGTLRTLCTSGALDARRSLQAHCALQPLRTSGTLWTLRTRRPLESLRSSGSLQCRRDLERSVRKLEAPRTGAHDTVHVELCLRRRRTDAHPTCRRVDIELRTEWEELAECRNR